MSVFPSWPWTNLHEENLDWLIQTVKACKTIVDDALADVSNAVATYFADHIDTTLTQSGEAADAAAVGNRLGALSNNIASVQASIPDLDVTLTSAQAAAPAATVGSRLASIQNDITNLQTATSHHTYKITLTESPAGTYNCALTALEGMTVNQTVIQMSNDLYNGYGMFINVAETRDNITNNSWCLAYNIHTDRTRLYVYFETESFRYTVHEGNVNPVTAVAK